MWSGQWNELLISTPVLSKRNILGGSHLNSSFLNSVLCPKVLRIQLFPSVYMSVSPSLPLFVHPSVHWSVYPSICPLFHLCLLCLSAHSSVVDLSVYSSFLSAHLSFHLPVCLPIHLSLCLSVCLFFCPRVQ